MSHAVFHLLNLVLTGFFVVVSFVMLLIVVLFFYRQEYKEGTRKEE